jgi:hypothetical protein
MEPLAPTLQQPLIRAGKIVLAVGLLLCTGCFDAKQLVPTKLAAAADAPEHLVFAWNSKVVYAPDPMRGGAPEPYLIGRMYLLGPGYSGPLMCDGSLIVDLYDATPHGPGIDPQFIEELRLFPDTLKKFVKEDIIGQGFTIPFVWRTYRPDITHVNMIARFDPIKGKSLLHQSGALALDHAASKDPSASISPPGTLPMPPGTLPMPQPVK